MKQILLIRHASTAGNHLRRYIGTTDEALCTEGVIAANKTRERLEREGISPDRSLFCSPMKRCLETAQILFPNSQPTVFADLRETNFGDFENKSYRELKDEPDYQQFLDSGGEIAFPNGESKKQMRTRVLQAFGIAMQQFFRGNQQSCAFVVHGGTIMTILSAYGVPTRDFYAWQVKNCGGFFISVDEESWRIGKNLMIINEWKGE